MKRKPYQPPLCRWKALGLLSHFIIKLKNKIRTSWFFFGPGWCKT
jgi:hypothetical protein